MRMCIYVCIYAFVYGYLYLYLYIYWLDPETRRAMNKSFQTSGGTVLSTNWGEVKKKDYEAERVTVW